MLILLLIVTVCFFFLGIYLLHLGILKVDDAFIMNNLKKFSSQKYVTILFGMIITAIFQSSSLITICLMSLMSKKLLSLHQALWLLLGANIGTTITNQLFVLNFNFIIFCLFLLFLLFFIKKQFSYLWITSGLLLLFISLEIFGQLGTILIQDNLIIKLLPYLSNPFNGLVIGTLMAAIMQSSSAAIGIIQKIVENQILNLNHVLFIIYGQNIGTCITGLMASIHAGKDEKKVMIFQILINVFGLILFLIYNHFFKVNLFIRSSYTLGSMQVAMFQSSYNIISVILLLPFDDLFIKVVNKIYR